MLSETICIYSFSFVTLLFSQGIVHRDVKPGNFLFSRKLNKGYLIDFNLAHVSYSLILSPSLSLSLKELAFCWSHCNYLICMYDRICSGNILKVISSSSFIFFCRCYRKSSFLSICLMIPEETFTLQR